MKKVSSSFCISSAVLPRLPISPMCLAGFCHPWLYIKFFPSNCPSGFNEITLIIGYLAFLSGFIILGHVLSLAFFLCCVSLSPLFFSPPSFSQSWCSRDASASSGGLSVGSESERPDLRPLGQSRPPRWEQTKQSLPIT